MTMVQMNTRIESGLKAQGDAALAEFGYSPSAAVRLLWGYAARNRLSKRAMDELIGLLEDPREAKARESSHEPGSWASKGPAIIEQCRIDLGLSANARDAWSCEDMDGALVDALEEDAARIRSEADAHALARRG